MQYPRMVLNPALAPALQSVYESTIDAWEDKAQRAIREFMVACFQSVESGGTVPPELVRYYPSPPSLLSLINNNYISGESLSAQQVLERAAIILRAVPVSKHSSILDDQDDVRAPPPTSSRFPLLPLPILYLILCSQMIQRHSIKCEQCAAYISRKLENGPTTI
jgi:hypothetical protein